MNKILKQKFIENYNMEMVAIELMDLIEDVDITGIILETFINKKFREDFMYGELYELFKDEVDKRDLKILLENMGYNFVDLDILDEESKQKYSKATEN